MVRLCRGNCHVLDPYTKVPYKECSREQWVCGIENMIGTLFGEILDCWTDESAVWHAYAYWILTAKYRIRIDQRNCGLLLLRKCATQHSALLD